MQNLKEYAASSVGLFLIGAIVGVLLPQPLDFLYFVAQNYLYLHPTYSLFNLSPKATFTLINFFLWYVLDSVWYILLFFFGYFLHIKNVETVKIITTIGILIGIGAVTGIILQLI